MKKLALTALAVLLAASRGASAAPVVYAGTLSGASATPPTASPGTGSTTVTIDTTAHTLRVQITFSGLLSPTTASHIHCCTSTPGSGSAGVATQTPSFVGFPVGVTAGTYDNTFDMTLASSWNATFITNNGGTPAGAEAALAAGLAANTAYVNIHTSAFPSGEIASFPLVTPVELVRFDAE